MKIILKHTLKSLLSHKMRTLMLVFCVFGCSLAALLSLDMSDSIVDVLRSAMAEVAGTTDVLFSSDVSVDEDFMDGAPENNTVPIVGANNVFTRQIPDMYGYVHQDRISVMGLDLEHARELKLIPSDLTLQPKEAAIPKKFADDYGYKQGDKLILHDKYKQPVEFTVASIKSGNGIFMNGTTILVNREDMQLLYVDEDIEINVAYIDVKDNSRIAETVAFLEEKFPAANVENLFESEEMQESIASVTRIFYVLFVVCLLLVIFVTVSVSERLIVEKMSVVGTMRSLGVSSGMTAFILLFENIMYGLIGGILGCVAYSTFRNAVFGSLLSVETSSGEIAYDAGSTSFHVYTAVVAGSVLLECICPIKEIIKAVRTPIRDIIFDNKDTQYKSSRTSLIFGVACAAAAVVSAFFTENFAASIICFISIAAAAAFLFPYALKFLASLLEKLFIRLRMPIARLAAMEVYSKKSTVGSAILCVTAASLSMVIFIFSTSLRDNLSYPYFDCDVIAYTDNATEPSMYAYIDDLPDTEKVEYLYFTFDSLKLNGKNADGYIYGWKDGGYELFTGLVGMPDSIGYDEIILEAPLMKKYGYSVGDKIEIEFKSDYLLPVTKTLTISGVCENDYYMTSGAAVIVSQKLFTDMYHDNPSHLLINSSNPDETAKAIEKYSAGLTADVQTMQEFMDEIKTGSVGIISILNALIVLGVGLTFVGMLSNQLIGFEGRKRECAVLTSAVMTKGQLSRMFLLESFFAALISVVCAVPLSMLMIDRFKKLTVYLQLYLQYEVDAAAYTGFAVMLLAVFTLTALFPIRAMKRMDTVTQLKYE